MLIMGKRIKLTWETFPIDLILSYSETRSEELERDPEFEQYE